MCFVGAGAVLGTVTSIGTSLLGNASASADAAKNNAYAAQQQLVHEQYRTKQMEYQSTTYAKDLEYRGQVQDYQESEFDRQVDFVNEARDNMEENYFTKVGGLLVRAFEEQIASSFEKQTVQAQGRAARATANVTLGERNVDGNTARQLEGELFRQEGESLTMSDMNDSARERQLRLDVMGLKAEHVSRTGQLQIQASAPLAPINSPSPIAPVAPYQQKSGSSDTALGLKVGSEIITGIGSYMKANGYSF